MAHMPTETPVNTDDTDDHLYVEVGVGEDSTRCRMYIEDPDGGSAELQLYGIELDDLIDALTRARGTVQINEDEEG